MLSMIILHVIYIAMTPFFLGKLIESYQSEKKKVLNAWLPNARLFPTNPTLSVSIVMYNGNENEMSTLVNVSI